MMENGKVEGCAAVFGGFILPRRRRDGEAALCIQIFPAEKCLKYHDLPSVNGRNILLHPCHSRCTLLLDDCHLTDTKLIRCTKHALLLACFIRFSMNDTVVCLVVLSKVNTFIHQTKSLGSCFVRKPKNVSLLRADRSCRLNDMYEAGVSQNGSHL